MNRKILYEINKIVRSKVLVVIDQVEPGYMENFFCDLWLMRHDDIEVWHNNELFPNNEIVRFVSREELDAALDLYRLYDFSDKVIVMSDTELYGTLFNYIKTQIITPKELAEILLLKD
ncbi:MAG: hypothetical protein IKO10_11140 [Lachnospiraceae bacterium]|nr:hypothetical protein [Lachnospiraceae bacterium]